MEDLTWKNDGRFLCLPDLVCSLSGGWISASGSQSLSSESVSPSSPAPCQQNVLTQIKLCGGRSQWCDMKMSSSGFPFFLSTAIFFSNRLAKLSNCANNYKNKIQLTFVSLVIFRIIFFNLRSGSIKYWITIWFMLYASMRKLTFSFLILSIIGFVFFL